MRTQPARAYRFNGFLLNVSERSLSHDGEPVQLTPKAFDTLVALVTRGGRLVEKDELLKEVWPDTFVEEATLTQNIFTLRKVLGPEGGRYIETVPKRGYRFVCEAVAVADAEDGLLMHRHTDSRLLLKEEYEEDEQGRAAVVPHRSRLRAFPRGRRLAAVATLAAVFATGGVWLAYQWRVKSAEHTATVNSVRKVAVLPFRPLGADSNNDMLGLGMADAVILKLSRIERLTVLPTGTIIRFAGHDGDQLAAGRELGVDAVLEGTVQRSGERVRVTVQLVALADGRTIWSDKFDDRFTNIFDIQDSISEQMARSLSSSLSGEERRQLGKRQTLSTAAYDSYLMGLFFWNKRSKEGLAKAIEYFEKAVGADPNYALAYAMLSDCYYLQLYYSYGEAPPEEILAKAKVAAERALALDDTLAEAHLADAMLKGAEGYGLESMSSLRRARELNPNLAVARLRLAWMLADTGRLDEAVSEMKRAQELDVLSPANNGALGMLLVYAHRAPEGLVYSRKAFELDSENYRVQVNLAYTYFFNGMYDESLEQYRRAEGLKPEGRGELLPAYAYVYLAAGRREEALGLLPEAERLAREGKGDSYALAVLYGALGDKDKGLEWLDRALGRERVQARALRYDPQLEPLRHDKRFAELLMRHGRSRVLTRPAD